MASCCKQSLLRAACSGAVTEPHLELLVRTSKSVIVCAPAAPNSTPLPGLAPFMRDVIRRTKAVTPAMVLLATSYLTRLERKLPSTARGLACSLHRIVLAALLIATKYLHDGPVRNRVWAANSRLFSLPEINLMERQLLFLLDFELATDPAVLMALVDSNSAVVIAVPASSVPSPNSQAHAIPPPSLSTPRTCQNCVAQAAEFLAYPIPRQHTHQSHSIPVPRPLPPPIRTLALHAPSSLPQQHQQPQQPHQQQHPQSQHQQRELQQQPLDPATIEAVRASLSSASAAAAAQKTMLASASAATATSVTGYPQPVY
ncbi:hypothetical protein PhCBS80983_g00443 [Powellomyces hirtus]|uniref:Cyclin N-terminal domain-containing protein n=1 Tax=Powellomyces hirtus TaxID=109895 RepID=A0A507EFX1_9FUNG|nr:hypothetical protein PhCBS80983_g00443 [Powellomyces hirtus]